MTTHPDFHEPIQILLVEDNAADADLIQDQLERSRISNRISVVVDGIEAESFLRREGKYTGVSRPDLILLDLNLPRRGGVELLSRVKSVPQLRSIPIVVLSSSEASTDVSKSYAEGANCYVAKPLNLDSMKQVVETIENFWFTFVKLPPHGDS